MSGICSDQRALEVSSPVENVRPAQLEFVLTVCYVADAHLLCRPTLSLMCSGC